LRIILRRFLLFKLSGDEVKTKASILKGTALLTGAGLIVKLMGAAYRIPLARLIGAEGIGLYQMAYPIYLIFLSLSTAGLPIAISKIIAEETAQGNMAGQRKVFRGAVVLLFLLGLLGSAGMALAAPWLAGKVVADPRAVYAMWALAPAIFFMSMMAAFRGYFQGRQDMLPSAASQIAEQIIRVSVALILAVLLIKNGIEHAAAGAAFGATAGGVAGLIYLMATYFRKRRFASKSITARQAGKSIDSSKAIDSNQLLPVIGRLVRLALPISIAVILMPLLQTLDSIIVPSKLQSIGYTVKQATSALGILGNSWAVLYLPMIVTGAINTNLVPVIAATNVAGMKRLLINNVQDGLRLASIYLIPVAVIFYLCGSWIYRVIYGMSGVEVLSWFAPAVIFLGMEQVTAGILQGLGRPNLPLMNFTIGAIIKITVTFVCTGWPGLNLAGAALGTVCGAGLTACLNLTAVKRLVGLKLTFLPVTILSGVVMLLGGWYLKRMLHLYFIWELLLVGFGGVVIYFIILWITGGIKVEDLEEVSRYFNRDSAIKRT
jgi:stage V sporulation protein B